MTTCCSSPDQPLVREDIQSLTITVAGKRVHYLKAGSRGPALVLVHGGASTSRDWLHVMGQLSDICTLYAPDLIGYGLSEKGKTAYRLSEFVEFIRSFMDAVGVEKAALIGHSIGGRVSLELALRFPKLVPKLVLVDTVGFGRLRGLGLVAGAVYHAARKLLGLSQPYPKFLTDERGDRHWRCLGDLKHLRVPTLIVWSQHDPYFGLAGAFRARELIPNVRLEVMPGFGHAPHVSNGTLFLKLLTGFLSIQI